MHRSVRWRLILNSLLISASAIIGVGLVTLLLVDGYFERQEKEYLEKQAELVIPLLSQVARWTPGEDVESIVAVTGLMSDVRIRILDRDEAVVADSGPRGSVTLFDEFSSNNEEFSFVISMGRKGEYIHVSPFDGERAQRRTRPVIDGQPLEFGAESDLTSISDTTLQLPLSLGGETLGYLELSEGPAVGAGVIRSIQTALVGGSLAALFVAIVVGSLSARQVTRPLVALGDAADKMTSADLTARAPQSHMKEYDNLAGKFNDMADRLSGTIEQLQAERAILRRMIGDASHELRTPLTALKTFNALLHDEVESGTQAATFIDESGKQIDQLDRMTTGLLDLSRLEGRLSGTSFVKDDVRTMVAEAVKATESLAELKRQAVHVEMPAHAVWLSHDTGALQQALSNLLSNAMKYTPEGGEISLTLREQEAAVEIKVEDNGVGISAESLPYIFDRFYRDPTHKQEGTGLGLAIAQEIVHIHSGTLKVASTLNHGSLFIITLPKS